MVNYNDPDEESAQFADFDEWAAAASLMPAAAVSAPASGLYVTAFASSGTMLPGLPASFFKRDELRLDVDGTYPQMTASGIVYAFFKRVHWVASLKSVGPYQWEGSIWYKDGATTFFPFRDVRIKVTNALTPGKMKAVVQFSGGTFAKVIRIFAFKSPYFYPVEFEFDSAAGVTPATSIGTHDHPNYPASLPDESLSIETVYRRVGFDVRKSGGDGTVPLAGAGADARWSNAEMHDAMQTYWSRFANRAQWSMWVLFAALHEDGTSLGGIMFDDIGPNHRQGTSLFLNSFIATAPAGDGNPAAWVARMRFWTAVHEMGHAFNLAHSWQKAHPPEWGTPWIPIPNEPEARSFMNYPYRVAGGQSAFFADFEFRFSDAELLFMRHAPERFVQMGNADWFDQHAFEQAVLSPEPKFNLILRANRDKPVFEFLEPVVVELKLTNLLAEPQLVPERILRDVDNMTIIIKKDGRPARQFVPYARECWHGAVQALAPAESLYESLFLSVGRNGWDIAEPGYYTLQVALHREGEYDLVSNPLRLRILPSAGYDEERVAQDFFSDEVGRILTFDGSRYFTGGNDILREVSDRFSTRKVAYHARVALASAEAIQYKQLMLPEGEQELTSVIQAGGQFKVVRPKVEDAKKEFAAALTDSPDKAAESLGHIDFKYYADRFSDWLADQGDKAAAAQVQSILYDTLTKRKVLERVLNEIASTRDSYMPAKAPRKPRKRKK